MNQLAVIAGGVALLVVARPEARKALGMKPSEGAAAAMAALPKNIGGIDISKRDAVTGRAGWFHAGSPIDAYVVQRRALVAARGALSTGNPITDAVANLGPYPASMTARELRELADGWLAAFRAGRDASAGSTVDFALAYGGQLGIVQDVVQSPMFYAAADDGTAAGAYGDNWRTWPLTSLGRAVCALLELRRKQLGDQGGDLWSDVAHSATENQTTGDALIRATFDVLWSLAGAMEQIGYALPGARPSEVYAATHDYGGAAAAAAKASGDAVKHIAGAAVGAAVELVLSSPIFWVAAGAFVLVAVVPR